MPRRNGFSAIRVSTFAQTRLGQLTHNTFILKLQDPHEHQLGSRKTRSVDRSRWSGRRHVPNAKHGVDLRVPSTCWPYGASVPSGRARERLLLILCILPPAARTSEHIFEI